MSNQEILVEKQQHIGIITLNRPDAFNTFNVPFARQLNDSLVALDNDDDIRVVVVRANGPQFSIGISLDEFKGKCHKEFREFLKGMDEHNHTISKMKKPVIASVKGMAIANGAGLVFACDMAVASEKARFGTTAINVGLICLGPARISWKPPRWSWPENWRQKVRWRFRSARREFMPWTICLIIEDWII